MLTASTPASADAAASYYASEGLAAEGGFRGDAVGKGAALLGLSGPPSTETLKALIRNRTPEGERLTQRDRHDKKPLTDFCFSPPKPVAIVHQVFGDKRIPGEVMAAAVETARFMEKRVTARVKRLKKYHDVTTGIAVILPDYHFRTRPVEGVSDPGDHVHMKFMNVTWVGGKRYSAQLEDAVRDSALYRDMFHANLRGRMERLGYQTRPDGFTFKIEGISDAMVRKFSRRSELIEMEAKRRQIKTPRGKAALGAKISEKKAADLKADKLFEEWLKRLTPEERQVAGSVTRRAMDAERDVVPLDGLHLAQAAEKLLDAFSCVPEEWLLTEAMRQGVGEVSLEGLQAELAAGPYLRGKSDGVDYVATQEAMRRENEVVQFARDGGIRAVRTKRGEVVPTQAGEALIRDADSLKLSELHGLVERAKAEGFRLVLQEEKARDYRDKASRGKPMVWLEDVAGLKTGQKRPKAPMVAKAAKVTRAWAAKVRRGMEAMRRWTALDQHREQGDGVGTRQAAREHRGFER